ncbi:MAG: hypothetical protein GQ535_06790 [Rhodobacteraceae bacterium]|nr:hypothetical protein [Paracoccaceae bacterium]
MKQVQETKQMADIAARWITEGAESTGATTVNYSGTLYNVKGSTSDPYIGGTKWKPLLIHYGINSACYVTSPLPTKTGTSHPGFDVGGHMTPNTDGDVAIGGSCYLMPLCKWHNNTARDDTAFSHTNTLMLLLTGYMQGELAVSFMARLPSNEPFSLAYSSDGHWQHKNLSEPEATEIKTSGVSSNLLNCKLEHYVLLERNVQGDQTTYEVRSSHLPS